MIKILETLARANNEPVVTGGYPMFECLPSLEIDDNENINNYIELGEINEEDIQVEERL